MLRRETTSKRLAMKILCSQTIYEVNNNPIIGIDNFYLKTKQTRTSKSTMAIIFIQAATRALFTK